MKNILIFHFDLQGGGAERVLVNLLNHLDPTKYNITLRVLFGVGTNLKQMPPNVHFRPVFRKLFRGLPTILKIFSGKFLYRLFVRNKYDIEIAYLETLPTRIIAYSTNTESKKLAWVHTTMNEKYPYARCFRNLREATNCYNKFDRILFVSQGTLDAFNRYLPDVNAPKSVIYNVNDYDIIKELAKEPIENGVINSSHFNICAVGRLIKLKGYDRLIKAFARVKQEEKYLDAELFIIGQGEEQNSLEALIEDEDLSQSVHLLGFKDNPYKFLAKMDLFVCSSTIEGYSTVVTEAISLGVPVITTNCSGMDEILHDGKYGMIVNNDDESLYQGLKKIIASPDLLIKYRESISKDNTYNTESFVERYEQLFDEL